MSLEPRKRPQQGRARATYDAIVEAAARIVADHGLTGFNTNAVAERAGISIGSLYQYFANKDAVMAALIQRQQALQLETLRAASVAIGPSARLETVVRALVRAAMQHHHDDALLASAIDHEEARLPVDDVIAASLDSGGAIIKALLERFAADIPAVDPQAAVRTLPALVRAVTDAWANLDPPQLDRAEEESVRAVLGYLRYAAA